jgi:hypothetical protein
MVLLCSLNFQRFLGQLETSAPAHFCPCAAFEVEMFRRFDVRIVPPNPGSRAEKVESFIWVLVIFFPACRQKKQQQRCLEQWNLSKIVVIYCSFMYSFIGLPEWL